MAMNCRGRVGRAGLLLAWATAVLVGPSAPALAQAPSAEAAATPAAPAGPPPAAATSPSYILGPDDVIAIKAMDADEINAAALRVDSNGFISLPLLGRVPAGGSSVERLEKEIATRLQKYVRSPVVAVNVVEYRSQPVSVCGSRRPARRSPAGRPEDARRDPCEGGRRPARGGKHHQDHATFGMGPDTPAVGDHRPIGAVQRGAGQPAKHHAGQSSPEQNILIKPNDVISVPKADIVYVIGEVKKPGGFTLSERSSVSGVRALAMADGLTPIAAPHKAVIIRQPPGREPIQIPVNLKEILNGKQRDVEVLPDDILFIPTNVAKNACHEDAQHGDSGRLVGIDLSRLLGCRPRPAGSSQRLPSIEHQDQSSPGYGTTPRPSAQVPGLRRRRPRTAAAAVARRLFRAAAW